MRWLSLVLFGTALIIRIIFIISLSGTLYWDLLSSDSNTYYIQGRAIAEGTFEVPEGFFMTPLYPVFLALFNLLGLEPFLWARLVQALLGALTAVFVYRLVFEATGKRWAGVIGGGLLAILGPAIFHDSMLLVTCLTAFLLTGAALRFVRFYKDGRTRDLIWAGVFLGLAGLAWGTVLAALPALVVWLVAIGRRDGWRRVLGRVGILLGFVFLPILPVTVYNAAQSGEFILTTANLGINLDIGNRAGANGLYNPPSPFSTERVFDGTGRIYLSRISGRHVTLVEANRYWLKKALRHIAAHPGEFIGNLFRKAWYFVHGFEWPQLESYDHYKEVVPWLGLPWPTLAVVMPLALLGLGLAWRWRRELAPVYLIALFYAAAVTLFFITGRYRYPVVPIICALAGIAVWRVVEFVREKRWRALGASAGVLAVLAVGVNIRSEGIEILSMPGLAYYNIASRLMITGRTAESLPYFELAEEGFGNPPSSLYLDWGVALHRQDQLEEALERYLQAAELGEVSPKLPTNLATAYSELGRHAEAEEAYLWAMRVAPDWRDSYLGAAKSAGALGRPLDGVDYLDGGLTRLGSDPVMLTLRGDLRLAGGDLYGAKGDYEDTLTQWPDFTPAVLGLGRALSALGDTEGARERFEGILALTPGNPEEAQALRPLREQARELLRKM
jgi:tetratricopeptide (TPR) repeat protein